MSDETTQAALFDMAPTAPETQGGFEEKLMSTLINKFREISTDLSTDEVNALVDVIATKTDNPDDILKVFPLPQEEEDAETLSTEEQAPGDD